MEKDRKNLPSEVITKGVANSKHRFAAIDGAPSPKTPEQARAEYLRKKASKGSKDNLKSTGRKSGKKGKA